VGRRGYTPRRLLTRSDSIGAGFLWTESQNGKEGKSKA